MSIKKSGNTRMDLLEAIATARQITANKAYDKDGQRIPLPGIGKHSFADAEYITSAGPMPTEKKQRKTTYALTNDGSFSAARRLLDHPEHAAVHNFANARTPGGGVLHGARAQEEALCRESTLYASLTSQEAQPYYSQNEECKETFYPDSILFSPSVAVFRDDDLRLLDKPFATAVFTAAAPNLYGRASMAGREAVMADIESKFTLLLRAAAERGVKALVLGAWGCGAFGNDARDVAGIFHRMLVDEGMGENFETIIFAVRSPKDAVNVTAFQDAFADVLEDHVYLDAEGPLPKLDAE